MTVAPLHLGYLNNIDVLELIIDPLLFFLPFVTTIAAMAITAIINPVIIFYLSFKLNNLFCLRGFRPLLSEVT